MILNSGLDEACIRDAATTSWTPEFCRFLRFAAFGTDATTPTAGDLLLGSQEGSRSTNAGGFATSTDGALDAGNNIMWFEAEFTRVFDITTTVTAREWGLAAGSTGNLSVRDLFRDLSNNPTAIPLEAGDQLQLVIKFRVQAAWQYETKSFVIAGTAGNDSNGTHTGSATMSSGSSTTVSGIKSALQEAWPGGAGTGQYAPVVSIYLAAQTGVAKNDNLLGASVTQRGGAESYTLSNYYRDWTATIPTSSANGTHYAWLAGGSSQGYRFILTDPPSLTKTNTHRLALTIRKFIERV